MKAKLYNIKGDAIGDMELKDEIFARPWNPDLVHQALITQTANRRKPWAHTKGRSEVRGGGRKPWKQKHTGRSRQGSSRSPIWRGGGITHGPLNERNYERKINKKMLRAAIHSVLSKKLLEGELRVVDSLELKEPKTKILFNEIKKVIPALLIANTGNKNIFRASRNIPKVKSLNGASINVEDLLKYKNVLLDKKAVAEIK
ncbi:MAG: 50S ribosomal protein L4 [Candidatus Harrisonbacteria bacterium]|nr:50S ribosomal protein L4 [Candidatus Harrisonbacteria bacterium]